MRRLWVLMIVGHHAGLAWGDRAAQHAAIKAGLPVCDDQGNHCLHLIVEGDNTDADLGVTPLYLFDGTLHGGTLGVEQYSTRKKAGEKIMRLATVAALPRELQAPPTAAELVSRAMRMFVDRRSGVVGSGDDVMPIEATCALVMLAQQAVHEVWETVRLPVRSSCEWAGSLFCVTLPFGVPVKRAVTSGGSTGGIQALPTVRSASPNPPKSPIPPQRPFLLRRLTILWHHSDNRRSVMAYAAWVRFSCLVWD